MCHLEEYTVDLLFPINSSVIYKQQVSGKRKLKFPIKIPLTACDDGEPSATESTLRKAFNLNVTSEKHQVSNNIFNNYKSLHLMMMMVPQGGNDDDDDDNNNVVFNDDTRPIYIFKYFYKFNVYICKRYIDFF